MSSLAGLSVDLDALERLSPAEQDAVREQLALVERAYRENPLLNYRPHVRQAEFHRSMENGEWPPLRAFFGGNRSGKTTAAMVDTIVQCVDPEVVPEHLRAYKRWDPPFKCRVLTPDFGDTLEVVLEKVREWCPKGQLRGGGFDRAYDKVKRVLWFKNGSRLHFNSNVQDRDQLGGSDLHRIVYDEEPRQDLRTESLTRIIDHDGEEIFAMTPLSGMSWMYDEIYEPWERGELPEAEARVLVVDMDDNPHLSESGKARALAAYSPTEREARKSGRFVSFAGLIYTEWKRHKHIVPDADLPEGVDVFVGIDAGLKHPAVVFAYLRPDDHMVVFDEIAPEEGGTVAVIARKIHECNARWKITPRWYVIDPSARNKNPQTGRSDQDLFWEHGIPTFPGQNAVLTGIGRVKERLEQDKLSVAASCRTLQAEFKRYRWKSESQRSENEREAPVKKFDHCLDALRYLCMSKPLPPIVPAERSGESPERRALRAHMDRLRRFGSRRHADSGAGPGIFA